MPTVFLIKDQLDAIEQEYLGLIIEPQGRNTAGAVALAAITVHARYPNATMVVVPSDHGVRDDFLYAKNINEAILAMEEQDLVLLGVSSYEGREWVWLHSLGTFRRNFEKRSSFLRRSQP